VSILLALTALLGLPVGVLIGLAKGSFGDGFRCGYRSGYRAGEKDVYLLMLQRDWEAIRKSGIGRA